jgi:hypothetical protein
VEGEGRNVRLIFTTNVGDEAVANTDNRIRVETDPETAAPSPYLHVRKGLEARIARPVFYQLADMATADEAGVLGVWSEGVFFRLGKAA